MEKKYSIEYVDYRLESLNTLKIYRKLRLFLQNFTLEGDRVRYIENYNQIPVVQDLLTDVQ